MPTTPLIPFSRADDICERRIQMPWAAAAIGGPGGYLLGMRAAGVLSAELWLGESASDGCPEPTEEPEHG